MYDDGTQVCRSFVLRCVGGTSRAIAEEMHERYYLFAEAHNDLGGKEAYRVKNNYV